MIKRLSAISILTSLTAIEATAHQDGMAHTHPHLAISNELLAGLFIVATAVLAYAARKTVMRHRQRAKSQRGRR